MVLLDRHQEGSIETLQHTCRKTPGCSSTGLRCPVEKQQQQQKKNQLRAVKRVLQCTKISTQL